MEAWEQVTQPEGMRAGDLILSAAHGNTEWPSQGSAGDVGKGKLWTDQLSYHPDPDPEL